MQGCKSEKRQRRAYAKLTASHVTGFDLFIFILFFDTSASYLPFPVDSKLSLFSNLFIAV